MVGSVLLGVGNSWQIFAPPPWPSCTALSLSSIFGQYSHQYIVINIRPIFSSIQGQYCHQYIVINFVNLTIFDNMSIIISNSGQIFTPPDLPCFNVIDFGSFSTLLNSIIIIIIVTTKRGEYFPQLLSPSWSKVIIVILFHHNHHPWVELLWA